MVGSALHAHPAPVRGQSLPAPPQALPGTGEPHSSLRFKGSTYFAPAGSHDNWNSPQPHHRTGKVWKDDSNEKDRPHREKFGKEGVRPVPAGVTPGLRGRPKEQAEGPYWLGMHLSSCKSSLLLATLLQCLEDAELQIQLRGTW